MKGIAVFNTPGSNSHAVAELTLAFMFVLARNIYPAINSLKRRKWMKSDFVGQEVAGKILGLIGFGRIGQEVGQIASALGMRILVFKKNPITRFPGYPFELVPLETVLKKSDFVSLHIPLNEKTKNLITLRQISMMKNGSFLINCSRGGIVNEKDLLKALEQNMIAGAAVDVYEREPTDHYQLTDHPRIICTPHIGAASIESQEKVGIDIVTTVMEYLKTKYLFI
jgi:D-3-phosphoglycerate dehydrogenase